MKVLRKGDVFAFIDSDDICLYDKLPVGIYILNYDEISGFTLNEMSITSFAMPSKIFGNVVDISNRVINRFKTFNPNKNLGVMLYGVKGSGKSITAKHICNSALMPVIIIDKAINADMVEFFSKIQQKCILFFDEFDKNYVDVDQEKLLPLFDGFSDTNMLILLTCNSIHLINDNFISRPSRILYSIHFGGLTNDDVCDVINHNLHDKVHTENIMKICDVLDNVTMYTLCFIIDEVNFSGDCDIDSMVTLLNIDSVPGVYSYIVSNAQGTHYDISTNFSILNHENAFNYLDTDNNVVYLDTDNNVVRIWISTKEHFNFKKTNNGCSFDHKELHVELTKNPSLGKNILKHMSNGKY